MKLIQIEGTASTLKCTGCGVEGIGGTEPYTSAATGETRTPDVWYQDEDPLNFAEYCGACAANMVYEDPTRSVNQFYSDTSGTEILPEL